jgi:c-di-GMP-binding flagellar brake protein YcgR
MLREGQLVRLEFSNPGAASGVDATVTQISEHIVWLELAPSAPGALPLEPGERIAVRCWDRFGVYHALTQVVERAKDNPLRVAVESAVPVEASDNRRFFRVNVHVAMSVSPVKVSDPALAAAKHDIEATTVDLSPGGLKFLTSLRLMVGDKLAFRLPYGAESIELEGRVVRVAASKSEDEYAVSVELLNVSAGDEFKIVRLIFEMQHKATRWVAQ